MLGEEGLCTLCLRRNKEKVGAHCMHSFLCRLLLPLPSLLVSSHFQENVYQDERPFISARKVMHNMGEPYRSAVEIISFHTVSKVGGGGVGG